MANKEKIVLMVGGTSPEREVSKSSGQSIYQALINLGYTVKIIDPAYGKNQLDKAEQYFDPKDSLEISNRNYLDALNLSEVSEADLIFLGLHGKWGEDGTIQSLLELKSKKYTGSKVLSSALAMDKIMSKILFDEYGVQTPRWFALKNGDRSLEEIDAKIGSEFGYPAVIKPNDQGSTVGITICQSKDQIKEALDLAYSYSDRILIEEFIPGKELTVAVLDDKPLPVLEIKPKHDVYDYECKYTSGMSEYIVPAEIPKDSFKLLQEQAVLAFKALRCEIYARVDFRLNPENHPFALEVNTLPGMTNLSLVPKMAKSAGLSFEQLIEKIIRLSLR